MKLNKTSQYAIIIMEFIAKDMNILHNAKIISKELNIPYKYLTRIMTQLIDAELLKSIRGREGGYSMVKEASEIKIIDILHAVKESLNDKNCLLGRGFCNESKKCSLHDIWGKPKQEINNMFKRTTLDKLI